VRRVVNVYRPLVQHIVEGRRAMAAISTLPNGRALDSQRSSEKEHNSWEFIRPVSQDVGSYRPNVPARLSDAFVVSAQVLSCNFTFIAPLLMSYLFDSIPAHPSRNHSPQSTSHSPAGQTMHKYTKLMGPLKATVIQHTQTQWIGAARLNHLISREL